MAEEACKNRTVRRVLRKNMGPLGPRAYGYAAGKSCKLAPTMAFIFFGKVAKGPACLDLLGGLSMDIHPTSVGGLAGKESNDSPFLVAEGGGCSELVD